MKVEKNFTPITITLETREEAKELEYILTRYFDDRSQHYWEIYADLLYSFKNLLKALS